MKKILFISMLVLGWLPVSAQDDDANELEVNLEMRDRAEMRQGYGTPRYHNTNPIGVVIERTRIGVDWSRYNLEAKVSAQHTGVWGDEPQSGKASASSIGVSEAWAKYKFMVPDLLEGYVQVGRQVLSYDDERLLGADDWSATGRSHDALRAVLKTSNQELHALVALNQNEEFMRNDYYDGTAGPKNMQMLWYHNSMSDILQGSLLVMNMGMESGTKLAHEVKYLQTAGTYITFTPDFLPISGDAAFYYQQGKNISDEKISAFLASANGRFHLNDDVKVGAGFDYLSGTNPDATTNNTFNALYGSHHKFYGSMDYFSSSAMPVAGLIDLKAFGNMKLRDDINANAAFHYFRLDKMIKYTGKNEPPRRSLGYEVDLDASWQVQKYLSVAGGYCFIFPLRTMGILKPTGNTGAWQHWGWVSVTLNPTLFKSKH